MPVVIRSLVFPVGVGAIIGFLAGLVSAVVFVMQNQYFQHGMRWLITDALTTTPLSWLGRGALLGLVVGFALLAARLVLVVPIARIQMVRSELSRPQRIALDALLTSILISISLLVLALLVVNQHMIPHPYTRRYWVLNAGILGVAFAGLWLLWAALLRIRQSAVPRLVNHLALVCLGVSVLAFSG